MVPVDLIQKMPLTHFHYPHTLQFGCSTCKYIRANKFMLRKLSRKCHFILISKRKVFPPTWGVCAHLGGLRFLSWQARPSNQWFSLLHWKCVSRSVKSDSLWPHGLAHTASQVPQSMGFSRQEYWSGLPFPFPGDLPDPRIEPRPPA